MRIGVTLFIYIELFKKCFLNNDLIYLEVFLIHFTIPITALKIGDLLKPLVQLKIIIRNE